MLGKFSCFCCHLLTFFKINFFEKKNLSEILSVINGSNPDQDQRHAGPYLGPNCLQRLSADDNSRHLQGTG